ncbi:neurosecretory protein VGF isoform B [Alligator mississippiensis]|nr:neurosecretory protein VGF isoform B [Alligator mississippiensis]
MLEPSSPRDPGRGPGDARSFWGLELGSPQEPQDTNSLRGPMPGKGPRDTNSLWDPESSSPRDLAWGPRNAKNLWVPEPGKGPRDAKSFWDLEPAKGPRDTTSFKVPKSGKGQRDANSVWDPEPGSPRYPGWGQRDAKSSWVPKMGKGQRDTNNVWDPEPGNPRDLGWGQRDANSLWDSEPSSPQDLGWGQTDAKSFWVPELGKGQRDAKSFWAPEPAEGPRDANNAWSMEPGSPRAPGWGQRAANPPQEVLGRRRARDEAPEPSWAGARKLRQRQTLEHQLLERRYQELAESRRQAQEARQLAAREERLADLASDLLLRYLLRGHDGDDDSATGTDEEQEDSDTGRAGALLFEDEVAEDKRSQEDDGAAGADEDEIDPSTIDQLIEVSSQLHLPAQDVVDLLNEVEESKRKRKQEPLTPPLAKVKVTEPETDEAEEAWNELLPPPPPRRPVSNHLQARTEGTGARRGQGRGHGPPTAAQGRQEDEELENYIERVLMPQPQGFP